MLAATEFRESLLHDLEWRSVKRALKPISPQWLLNRREKCFYEKFGEIELQLLDILCDPSHDSLDVGANDGSFVHFLRGRSKTVHAFEPMPEQVATLHRKFRGGNVVTHPMALSRALDQAGATGNPRPRRQPQGHPLRSGRIGYSHCDGFPAAIAATPVG